MRHAAVGAPPPLFDKLFFIADIKKKISKHAKSARQTVKVPWTIATACKIEVSFSNNGLFRLGKPEYSYLPLNAGVMIVPLYRVKRMPPQRQKLRLGKFSLTKQLITICDSLSHFLLPVCRKD